MKKHGQKTTIEFLNMGSTTNLKENKTLFVPCDCLGEILTIEYDHELKVADLSIYYAGSSYRSRMSLWQRIKYCWRILVLKKLYADQIVLNNKQLLELKIFLSSLDLNYKIGV